MTIVLSTVLLYLPNVSSSIDVAVDGCEEVVPVIESYSQYLHVYSLTGLSQ